MLNFKLKLTVGFQSVTPHDTTKGGLCLMIIIVSPDCLSQLYFAENVGNDNLKQLAILLVVLGNSNKAVVKHALVQEMRPQGVLADL